MKQKWILTLKSYFTFNHYEKILILVLLFFIILITGALFYLNSNSTPTKSTFTNNSSIIDSLQELVAIQKEMQQTEIAQTDSIFYFNPNKADSSTLIKLGFYPKLASRLIKYRKKVPFKNADDLRKLYGISDELIDKLSPYMVFEKNTETKKETKHYDVPIIEKEIIKIDLNTADEEELMLLRGIGTKLSNRIVVYRSKLGGFLNKWQLLEVWGIDSAIILKNEKIIAVEINKINKINLNQAEWKELVNHPYIDKRNASLIINYRTQHGNYQSISDLGKIKALPKEFIDKIEPYLIIE